MHEQYGLRTLFNPNAQAIWLITIKIPNKNLTDIFEGHVSDDIPGI